MKYRDDYSCREIEMLKYSLSKSSITTVDIAIRMTTDILFNSRHSHAPMI